MKRTDIWAIFAVMAAFVPAAEAGTLVAGDPSVAGSNVIVPVLLQGDVGTGVATLDFTFRYDPAVFEPVGAQAGPAAQSARKDVQSNMINPGEYVVLVFGMNPTTMQQGEVVSVTLRRIETQAASQSHVAIRNTTFSSADGREIPSEGSTRTVNLTTPPGDGGTPTDPPPSDGGGGNNNGPPSPTPSPDPVTPAPPAPTPEPDSPGAPTSPMPTPVGRPSDPTLPTAAPSRPSAAVSGIASDTAPMGDMANRIAELNAATRQLEVARAALEARGATPGDRSMTDDNTSYENAGDPRSDVAAAPPKGEGQSGVAGEPVHTAMVATAEVASTKAARSAAKASVGTADSSEPSGIDARGRLLLTILVLSTAGLLIALRIRRRGA
jgi:hypothetical protein